MGGSSSTHVNKLDMSNQYANLTDKLKTINTRNYNIKRNYDNTMHGNLIGGAGETVQNNVINQGTQCYGSTCPTLVLII